VLCYIVGVVAAYRESIGSQVVYPIAATTTCWALVNIHNGRFERGQGRGSEASDQEELENSNFHVRQIFCLRVNSV
jgi:hypothetical protein